MQVKMIVFPSDDGFNVLIWGKWSSGSMMRVRSFENRTSMIAQLENLHLISPEEARELQNLDFIDSCPLYSSNIDEETLDAHGFRIA